MSATNTFASFIAVALLATGCATVGPDDFEAPDARFADAWQDSENNAIGANASDNAEWWKSFNDPVLDTLIVEAHANNLDLEMAGLRVYQARAMLRRLVGGAADGAGFETADANLDGAIATYDDFLVSLTGDVASGYVLLRTLQEQHAFAESNVALQKRSLGLAQERLPASKRTELDVRQAQALLNRTRASIPKLEYDIRRTMNALSVLLARPPGELNAILGGVGTIPTGPDRIETGLPAELLRARPDVRAALAATLQSARIGVTPLKNNMRVQDARLQQRIVNYQLTVLKAAQEVEDALTGYLKAREEVAFREASTSASQQAVDLALAQYRDGAANYPTVLDTQRLLARDQDQLTQARGSVASNLIAAYRAMGGGWQLRLDQSFVGEDVKAQMRERTDWGGLLDLASEQNP
jgi:outer membrane protein TolC